MKYVLAITCALLAIASADNCKMCTNGLEVFANFMDSSQHILDSYVQKVCANIKCKVMKEACIHAIEDPYIELVRILKDPQGSKCLCTLAHMCPKSALNGSNADFCAICQSVTQVIRKLVESPFYDNLIQYAMQQCEQMPLMSKEICEKAVKVESARLKKLISDPRICEKFGFCH